MSALLMTMSGVSKRFGATQALRNVSLEVGRGEVLALIGENGAGKSTLMKILSGVYQADSGSMSVEGRPYCPIRPVDGREAGVAMIYQELNLASHLSVEANIMLGRERSIGGWVQRSRHKAIAREALGKLSQGHLPLDTPVGDLPIAKQQLVEIARALASNAKVLIFDEPTSSLTEEDTAHLFQVIRGLRSEGLGIVYISHFLDEVAQIADRYTVLRDGEVVDSGRRAEVTLDEIVRKMVGRELSDLFPHVPHTPGEPLLEVRGLSGVRSPAEVDFTLRRGEIFGLAGLVGAGRSELVRCIYGLDQVRHGSVRVTSVGALNQNPRQSIQRGLGFVSENRKEEGLALEMSIVDNLTFTRLSPYGFWGWLNLRRREAAAREWMQKIQCKAAGPRQAIGELSGGNQQKIAIARLLHQQADLLLLDEPTRGIDIGTKAQIYRLIGELAARNKSIIMVSSYLPELVNVCDRIGVMCRGQLREVRNANNWTEEDIMHVATGREIAA